VFKKILLNIDRKKYKYFLRLTVTAGIAIFYSTTVVSSVFSDVLLENFELRESLEVASEQIIDTKIELKLSEEKVASYQQVPKGFVSIEPCSGKISLYQSDTYVFNYEFEKGFKKFTAVFTDSTGDLEIDLSQRLSDGSDAYSGQAVVNAFPEGEQGEGFLDLYVNAVDKDNQKYAFSCNYDLYSPNFKYEGNYRLDHIRTALIEDTYTTVTINPTGKVWEQSKYWNDYKDCAVSDWANSRIEMYNSSNKNEDQNITTEQYCLSEVGTYLPNGSWKNEFRYPQINLEKLNITGPSRSFGDDFEVARYQACFKTINTTIKNYVDTTLNEFSSEIGYGDHWATTLDGDYRLVGFYPGGGDNHFSFSASWSDSDPYGYNGDELWEANKQFMGHRNNLPSDYFNLQEFGLVTDESPAYISYIFDIYTYTGGNHGMYTYETFNFDLNQCKQVELRDMMSDKLLLGSGLTLPEGSDALWLNLLSSRLGDIWSVDLGQLPGYKDWSAAPWTSLNNNEQEDELKLWSSPLQYDDLTAVSINENGLTFSFQPYAVDCWACGWPELTISWGNLWDIFTWGDWDTSGEFTVYENTVVPDSYYLEIEDIAKEIKTLYEIEDLIYGATSFFTREYEDQEDVWVQSEVYKQISPTTYSLSGQFTEKDKVTVLKFIDTVNKIIGEELFSYSDNVEQADIPIVFSKCLNKRPYNSIFGGQQCSLGYYSPIDKRIWVEADLFGTERDNVIIHELGHSIGLFHSACLSTGVMSINNNNYPLSFSDFEIALINFLYTTNLNSGESIQPGMTANDISNGLEIDLEELTPTSLFCPDEVYTTIKEG